MSHQDWMPVDIGRGKSDKQKKTEESQKTSSYVPLAQGGIKEDEDGTKIMKYSREFIQAVIAKRVEMKLDQKKLALKLSYPVDFIKRFEQGKETYNSSVVSKIKKILNIHVEAKGK